MSNPNPWIEYQPDRNREKEFYDVELRNGVVVENCYPNGVHWNPWTSERKDSPKEAYKGPIADYRVVRTRRSYPDPFED
jgi:hypothetical protein